MRKYLLILLSITFVTAVSFLIRMVAADTDQNLNNTGIKLTEASKAGNEGAVSNSDLENESFASNAGTLGGFKLVQDLSDIQLEPTVQEITYQNLSQVFEGFLDYSSNTSNDTGYFLTTSKALVYFPLDQIRMLQKGGMVQNIYSFQLPESLSDDLTLHILSNKCALIQDRKQKLLMVIKLNHPASLNNSLGYASIEQTIQFAEGSDFNIITGYQTGDSYVAEISDKQNNVYQFNFTDLVLSNIVHEENWRTVSGYAKPNEEETYKSSVFLYQVDEQAHILRKIDRSSNQEVLQVNLDNLSIKGQIEKVMNDDDIIYLLVKEGNKQILYETNEKLQNFVYSTASYSDGSNWNNIDDIWYYRDGNVFGAITIFDKQSKNVVNFLQTYDWLEIK